VIKTEVSHPRKFDPSAIIRLLGQASLPRQLHIGIGGSRSWSWGLRWSAEDASRAEAPKAPRGMGHGEGVSGSGRKIFHTLRSKWHIFMDSVLNFVFFLWPLRV